MTKKRKTQRLIRATKAKNLTLYTHEAMEAMLPQVGDRLVHRPTTTTDDTHGDYGKAHPCTVVMVNRTGLWYMVQYDDLGFRECYKVPDLSLNGGGKR